MKYPTATDTLPYSGHVVHIHFHSASASDNRQVFNSVKIRRQLHEVGLKRRAIYLTKLSKSIGPDLRAKTTNNFKWYPSGTPH